MNSTKDKLAEPLLAVLHFLRRVENEKYNNSWLFVHNDNTDLPTMTLSSIGIHLNVPDMSFTKLFQRPIRCPIIFVFLLRTKPTATTNFPEYSFVIALLSRSIPDDSKTIDLGEFKLSKDKDKLVLSIIADYCLGVIIYE